MVDETKQSLEESFADFKQSVKTLQLSTLTATGKPNASYSPFVTDEQGSFFIFVSQLASHTQDLLTNPKASILLIQDEVEARQIFARQRISYQCGVEIINEESNEYIPMLDAMQKRFGNVVDLLRTLPDFILFRLTPCEGQYVKGFGKAYKLVGEGLLELEDTKT
jgi:putative heme iron utilization protein